ncbi:MAG: hypothetical protein HGJ93_05180 [Desulfosarcina sp.]|nr:hypothetical protein [Desulfosarcina sp.]MBC2765355.1 hypothetical protein [Desulfosarcina sp.]
MLVVTLDATQNTGKKTSKIVDFIFAAALKRDEKNERRSVLLVEDLWQVKVKSVFWLLFKPVGIDDEGVVRVEEITERDKKTPACPHGRFGFQWR